jgi:thymidylate synthase (FAD)
MRISEASFVIEDKLDGKQLLKNLERYGRTCYKSEAKITTDSACQFIAKLIQLGHESVLEHEKISVRVICDRGVSHEIVRHRLGSYSQESTRYCNYKKRGLEFIKPPFFAKDQEKLRICSRLCRPAKRLIMP